MQRGTPDEKHTCGLFDASAINRFQSNANHLSGVASPPPYCVCIATPEIKY